MPLVLPTSGYGPTNKVNACWSKKKPLLAVEHFKDPLWQGVALYQAGDYTGAALRFAEVNSASAHYNRGNALAMSGELEAAIDAYEQALELQPGLQVATQNKTLIEQLLEQKRLDNSTPPQTTPQTTEPDEPQTPASPRPPSASGDTAQHQENSSATEPDAQANNDDSVEPPPEPSSTPSSEPDDETTTRPVADASNSLDEEHRQALEQWLRQIPDNPSELLRRKFWYEQQQHQDTPQ